MKKYRENEKGFTLIEMAVVIFIIGILAAAALTTYFSTLSRSRLHADIRGLHGAMQLARMRAISTGIPHGVAFFRRDGDLNADSPDMYFIFVDCDGNEIYNDSDANPLNNSPITSWDACNTSLGYDPRLKEGGMNELAKGDYFTIILGWKQKSDAGSASLEYVTFNSLGQAVRGRNNLVEGEIYMQNHRYRGQTVDRVGVGLIGATGMVNLTGIKNVNTEDWK